MEDVRRTEELKTVGKKKTLLRPLAFHLTSAAIFQSASRTRRPALHAGDAPTCVVFALESSATVVHLVGIITISKAGIAASLVEMKIARCLS